MIKRLVRSTVATALATALLLSPALQPSASAATSCYATTCTGVDPQTSGCSKDARNIDEHSSGGGLVVYELRYSPTCYAAWTRIKAGPGVTNGGGVYGQILGFDCGTADTTCLQVIEGRQALDNEVTWTRMISFTYWVRSCHNYVHPRAQPNLNTQCTGKH
jgi:Protein of unknown function (DUF2690)